MLDAIFAGSSARRTAPNAAPAPAPAAAEVAQPARVSVRNNTGARPHDINIIVTVRTEPAVASRAPEAAAPAAEAKPSALRRFARFGLQLVGGAAATAGTVGATAGIYAYSLNGKVLPLLGHVSAATGEATLLAIAGGVLALLGGAAVAIGRAMRSP